MSKNELKVQHFSYELVKMIVKWSPWSAISSGLIFGNEMVPVVMVCYIIKLDIEMVHAIRVCYIILLMTIECLKPFLIT